MAPMLMPVWIARVSESCRGGEREREREREEDLLNQSGFECPEWDREI
jgi:hypothetical protein